MLVTMVGPATSYDRKSFYSFIGHRIYLWSYDIRMYHMYLCMSIGFDENFICGAGVTEVKKDI